MGWIKGAKELRTQGLSYRKIGTAIKKPAMTVYYHLNLERMKARAKARRKIYRPAHKEEIRIRVRAYYEAHKEERKAPNKVHRQAHQGECNARSAKRRALQQGALIGATAMQLAEIKEIYRRAKEGKKIRCYLYGKLIPIGQRHVDHIVPVSKGGQHRASNLAVACDKCNMSKGAKMPLEIGLLL